VGRPLAFTIMDGQDAITLSSTATVKITGTKPSGLGFTQDCTLSGNTASIDTVATMTQEAGSVPAELIVTDGSTVIGTANFVMYVEPAAHPEGTTDGDAETARDLMTRAQAAVEQAEAEADRAEDAAESASQTGISTVGASAGQVPTADGNGNWSWQDQQGGGGGTSDDIENKSSVSGSTVTGALNSLSDQIANLEGGAPTAVSTVAQMVDTTKIYLYTGSESGYNTGHWYYYSNGSWVDGGAYGEAASMSAGVKEALLVCFRKVAWIDENGQTYYNNLYNALYPPANLVSITAVYTQSGTVYDTSSLDDLKPDLVVTANYSDSTSETVTTYTLSGTLAVGTSTITVSYGGETASFSVTVTHDDYADWDYVWKYEDGLPPAADWSWSTSGGSGQTHTLIDDGLLVTAKNGTTARYTLDYAASAILSSGGGVAEFTLYIPSDGATANTVNASYFAGNISNGTNGIRVEFTHPKNTGGSRPIILRTQTDGYSADNTVISSEWNYDTIYKLRLEMDSTQLTGKVYLDDVLVLDGIDMNNVLYAGSLNMTTSGVTIDGTGKGFCVQSVKVKYGVPATA